MPGKQLVTLIATAVMVIMAGAAVMWSAGRMNGAATNARETPNRDEHVDAKGHVERDEHAQGEGHEEGEKEQLVRLTEVQRREFGIAMDTAGPGKLQMHITLPGQVALNADRRAHIVQRISGVVQQVHKNLGDPVRAGEVIAVIESRELAELKSAYLAAKERVSLAETTFRREEDLWK